jgi:hypothetical protein
MMRYILVVCGFLLLPISASAEFTGLQLRELCAEKDKRFCRLWISGFQAGLFATQQSRQLGMEVCLPNGFTGAQATLIVEKFMSDFPNTLHLTAEPLVFEALFRAFPCKKE